VYGVGVDQLSVNDAMLVELDFLKERLVEMSARRVGCLPSDAPDVLQHRQRLIDHR
jgi:hypothetical protein